MDTFAVSVQPSKIWWRNLWTAPKACYTLPQGGLDIGLKVGILAEIGYMLHECALSAFLKLALYNWGNWSVGRAQDWQLVDTDQLLIL